MRPDLSDDAPSARQAISWRGGLATYRNVLAVTAAMTFLHAGVTSLAVIIALSLRAQGISTIGIGLVASTYAIGFLVGTVSASHEIRIVGHIRAYALFSAVATVAVLAFSLSPSLVWWAGLQFLIGLCASGLMTVGDSWIADSAPEDKRGSVLGFYLVVTKSGVVAGPFLVSLMAGQPAAGLMLVAALLSASVFPVAATRRNQPDAPSPEPFGPREILRVAPAAVIAAFLAGLINNGVGQLYAVFASTLDPQRPAVMAAYLNAALIAGSMSAQWPLGALSDRIDRRLVIAGCAALGALASLALFLVGSGFGLTLTLLIAALFGAGAFSYYGIAVAHAVDRAGPGHATAMMAGLLLVWGLGSIAGPLLAGGAMGLPFGERSLFLFSGVFFMILFASMIMRRAGRSKVAEENKENYGLVPATSLAIAEIDPRGSEDEQLDLFSAYGETDPSSDLPASLPDAQGGA